MTLIMVWGPRIPVKSFSQQILTENLTTHFPQSCTLIDQITECLMCGLRFSKIIAHLLMAWLGIRPRADGSLFSDLRSDRHDVVLVVRPAVLRQEVEREVQRRQHEGGV